MTMSAYGHVNLESQLRALDELDRTLRSTAAAVKGLQNHQVII